MLVVTKVLLRSFYFLFFIFGRGKHTFVATNTCSVATKHVFAREKKYVFWGKNFCRDKIMFAVTNICRDKSFVATSILLSRQKTCFVVTKDVLCRDKHRFVATKLLSLTKMILVAASDTRLQVVLVAAAKRKVVASKCRFAGANTFCPLIGRVRASDAKHGATVDNFDSGKAVGNGAYLYLSEQSGWWLLGAVSLPVTDCCFAWSWHWLARTFTLTHFIGVLHGRRLCLSLPPPPPLPLTIIGGQKQSAVA